MYRAFGAFSGLESSERSRDYFSIEYEHFTGTRIASDEKKQLSGENGLHSRLEEDAGAIRCRYPAKPQRRTYPRKTIFPSNW
jgi:hypothetical protein